MKASSSPKFVSERRETIPVSLRNYLIFFISAFSIVIKE